MADRLKPNAVYTMHELKQNLSPDKNMTFEQKKARAIAIMESKSMWKSNYAPLLIQGLWKLGLKIPPLPFAAF